MMKKFIQATLAASLVATPLIAASAAEAQTRQVTTVEQRPNGNVVRKTTTVRTPARVANRTVVRRTTVRANNRAWRKGQRFDRRYAQNYRVVDYRQYRQRRLYAPPRGYHWVRSGNDAVLVGVTSGLIGAVLAGALR
jgi:Ni/Co efflux regulator RcnB